MTVSSGNILKDYFNILASAVYQIYDHSLNRTPLKRLDDACLHGNFRQAKRIILSGKVAINDRQDDHTPIMMAVIWGVMSEKYKRPGERETGHKQIVSLLLSHNADLSCVDSQGKNVWDLAEDNKVFLALLPARTQAPTPESPKNI